MTRPDVAEGAEIRLCDVANMVTGVAITVAPWFNGDDAYTNGAIRLRLVAACVCIVSLWVVFHQRDMRAQIFNAALGVALVTAPWWRGGLDPYRVDMALAGALIAAFSVSSALHIARKPRERLKRELAKFSRHRISLN